MVSFKPIKDVDLRLPEVLSHVSRCGNFRVIYNGEWQLWSDIPEYSGHLGAPDSLKEAATKFLHADPVERRFWLIAKMDKGHEFKREEYTSLQAFEALSSDEFDKCFGYLMEQLKSKHVEMNAGEAILKTTIRKVYKDIEQFTLFPCNFITELARRRDVAALEYREQDKCGTMGMLLYHYTQREGGED